MDLATEFVKLGPAGLTCLCLWYMNKKSEDREAKKDLRIQYLENQLTESYDERIAAANQVASALIETGTALKELTREVRNNR